MANIPSIKPQASGSTASLSTERIAALSPHLATLMERYPETLAAVAGDGIEQVWADLIADFEQEWPDEAALSDALRQFKERAALVIGLADLGLSWTSDRVGAAMAEVADICVAATVRHLIDALATAGKLKPADEQFEPLAGCGYTVIAMGKHGARELNYSSDIDLIVLCDPDAPRVVDRSETIALFTRLTRSLVRLLQERTAHGYVFRCDLRLRPDPGSMPLALSTAMAMAYYEGRGQNWERAAFIKARAMAGDIELGQSFLQELKPFVWRRYLDYAAIADIHSIKRQLQAHRDIGDMNVPGHNVKLGRGGIREIEFFAQTQQLIAGGRMPELRVSKTLEALSALRDAGWIEGEVQSDLAQSYAFLRDVEHRLQLRDDAQTHTIPEDDSERRAVAELCGYPTLKAFDAAVLKVLTIVEAHYGALFEQEAALSTDSGPLSFTGTEPDPETLATLAALGFDNGASVHNTLRKWHFARDAAFQSADARARLTEMTPLLLQRIGKQATPNAILAAFDSFLERLPAGFQLFHMLHSNPNLLDLLLKILAAAPRLANIIVRRPHVFDAMLEPGFFETVPDPAQGTRLLERSLALATTEEERLDRLRVFTIEQRFLIGVRVLAGSVAPASAGPLYSGLAETVLAAALQIASKSIADAHGHIPDASLAVVAMGNLGTRELSATSDLDLIVIFETPEDDTSDGPRPLQAAQYFARLTQRLIATLSAPTAEGIAYELDFRLRPSGKSGPIATSFTAFARYQRQEAWTWEHLALTRARVVAGDEAFGARVQHEIDAIIHASNDAPKIRKDALEMRLVMEDERWNGDEWDVKLAPGGLVDLEFIAQTAMLTGANLPAGTPTASVLKTLDATLQHHHMTLAEALHTFQGVNQLLRTCTGDGFDPETAPRAFIERLLGQLELPDLSSALLHLDDIRQGVRAVLLERLQTS